jgi:hypothetical protein
MAGAEPQLALFCAVILASGYDGGPAGGPVAVPTSISASGAGSQASTGGSSAHRGRVLTGATPYPLRGRIRVKVSNSV